MRTTIALLLPCLLAHAIAAELPAGTELHIRLQSSVSSASGKAGQAVEAVLIAPVTAGEQLLLPPGLRLRGRVEALTPASQAADSLGEKGKGRAQVELRFTELLDGQDHKAPLAATLARVDNARETVDAQGRVVGILASETLASRIDQGIGKLSQRNTKLADFLDLARRAVLKEVDPEIAYAPGVEMTLRLREPLRWDRPVKPPALAPVEDEAGLARLVQAQPFRTMAEQTRQPSDLTTLMFVGTAEEIESAFREAGWNRAAALDAGSVLETVAAVAELRGYKEAPMSVLTLDGRRSDMDLQKGNNTFAMRHHLRMWRRPETWQGKPVWVSSATHDTGIEFSAENRTFIHTIDPEIDRERAKIVTDLLFTGKVRSLALVERPDVPRQTKNGTGDEMRTDGRMAVVVF